MANAENKEHNSNLTKWEHIDINKQMWIKKQMQEMPEN